MIFTTSLCRCAKLFPAIRRISLIGLISLSALIPFARAAVPPVEQLLPADTLGFFSVPDWDKLATYFAQSQFGQLWQDPALKPFQEKLLKEFKADAVAPLEKELGIKLSDYSSLVRGQVTFAVIQAGWDGRSDSKPGVYLLIDTKDQSERLTNQIAELRKKWFEAGRQLKSEKIRGVEFTTVVIRSEEVNRTLDRILPSPSESDNDAKVQAGSEAKGEQFEISFGQSESLLILSNTLKDMEKILIRQSGGLVPTLGEQPAYETNHAALFRDALAFGWLNFKRVYETLIRQMTESAPTDKPENPMMPSADKVLAAIGLNGLETIVVRLSGSAEGTSGELFVGVPEANRQGIFQILAPEAKDSAPPLFVPADAVKFSRWRIDGQKTWATIEAMLGAISPEMSALLKMTLGTVGKDKDPEFDFKKNLVGNLGDDFVTFEKNPRSAAAADVSAPPTLYLVGSPDPEKLAHALSASASIMPLAASEEPLKEREFLGRKIYSFPLPTATGADSKPAKFNFNFAASRGYVGMSTDVALLEEYLRSTEGTGKTLQETAGLNEAAQKVGGMNTGFFGFENHGEGFRVTLETLKNDAARLNKILTLAATVDKAAPTGSAAEVKDWFDPALLPPFDQVAKYFHFAVYGGSASASGLSWKLFLPTPPQLRK